MHVFQWDGQPTTGGLLLLTTSHVHTMLMQLPKRTGALTLRIAEDVGGVTLVMVRTLRRMFPPRMDLDELMRAMLSFGEASIPIVVATAAFVGMIMVLQAAAFVEQFGVYHLVGWFRPLAASQIPSHCIGRAI